eukprot:2541028-Lingulodinium_polyedra.AAC.1
MMLACRIVVGRDAGISGLPVVAPHETARSGLGRLLQQVGRGAWPENGQHEGRVVDARRRK